MNNTLFITIIVISAIGSISAVVLYFVSKKFVVFEDPRIDEVEALLPSSNCGNCGFAGCRAFADACISADSLNQLNCPVGGNETMKAIAQYLQLDTVLVSPKTAVLRCNGNCEVRPKTSKYEGVLTCGAAHGVYGGETGCHYGCLGFGDCAMVCQFDALHMNQVTGLPEVDDLKCNGCGACIVACPRLLLELRKQMPKHRKVFVACRNKDKGKTAAKACKVACTGCQECQKVCNFGAITIGQNLAYIDAEKCTLCRKCVTVCHTNAILEINFPARKIKGEQTTEA
jgi:Na+-translocating ferredoxin:NAD+ oxidoreductase RNF subunit RnfB